MSTFRNCGPFTAGIILRILPRRLIVLQLLGAAVATTPLFAQQSLQPNRAQVYVDKYAEQLAPLKEARFAYSEHGTRHPQAGWFTLEHAIPDRTIVLDSNLPTSMNGKMAN